VGSEVVAEPRGARIESLRRTRARELSSEEMLIAYGELEREMNELRNNIVRKTNPSETEALSAWRERVQFSRAEAYGIFELRAAKSADTAKRVRERRYGGARIIEVAPIRESTANANAIANATVNATNAPEGRSTGVAYEERAEEMETTDTTRVKPKSIKKKTTSENKKIRSEKRERQR